MKDQTLKELMQESYVNGWTSALDTVIFTFNKELGGYDDQDTLKKCIKLVENLL